MRPIGANETRVTMAAVRLSALPSGELLALVARGGAATPVERKAAKRVLRLREREEATQHPGLLPVMAHGRVVDVLDVRGEAELCGCQADEFGRPVRKFCEQHREG